MTFVTETQDVHWDKEDLHEGAPSPFTVTS